MLWSTHRDALVAYTCGTLTYVPVLKNASSFFRYSFEHSFKWRQIKFSDIDWAKQHVFGYIQDPIIRRHKGIVEYLGITNTIHLLEDLNFQNFISDLPVLDEHTVSIAETFGNFAWLIDWIPMSDDHSMTIKQTEKLLRYGGFKVFDDKWNMDEAHKSRATARAALEKVKSLWNRREFPTWHYSEYLLEDMRLYKKVCANFNPHADHWLDTSWLRNNGHE